MAHVPATVALCSILPRAQAAAIRPGREARRTGTQGDPASIPIAPIPVTHIVDLETLLGMAADEPTAAADLALAIDPAWLASRQGLRDAIGLARAARPSIEAAVLRGAALRHHDVVAEAGIRVVVSDGVEGSTRGSRRPAPRGWPCHNVAWGLWEVRLPMPRRSAGWGWLPGLGSGPSTRSGSLHVLCADAGADQLAGWRDWTARRVARGEVTAVTLSGLRAMLESDRRSALAGSVLRAA